MRLGQQFGVLLAADTSSPTMLRVFTFSISKIVNACALWQLHFTVTHALLTWTLLTACLAFPLYVIRILGETLTVARPRCL